MQVDKSIAGEKDVPRILFLLDNLSISGADKVALSLLREAKERGLAWDALVFMDDEVGAGGLGVELLSFAEPKGHSEGLRVRIIKALRRTWKLRALAKSYDLVVPVTPPTAPFATLACLGSGVPVAPWVHYDWRGVGKEPLGEGRKLRDALQRLVYRWWVPFHQSLIFVSQGSMDSFARFKRPSSNWMVVGNAFEAGSMFKGVESIAADEIQDDRDAGLLPLVLLGRVTRQKRWEWSLEVMELLSKSDPGRFSLHLIGDGPEMGKLSQMAKDHRWASLPIRIHGFDKAPKAALSKAAGLMLTSLHEAWPTVILEAFELSIPVFAIDCPSGPADMVGSLGERGWLSQGTEQMAGQISKAFAQGDASMEAKKSRAKQLLLEHEPQKVLDAWIQACKTLGRPSKVPTKRMVAASPMPGQEPSPGSYSVAMGAFNGASFIEQQLQSVLTQDLTPAKVVVRDDASWDATARIAKDVLSRVPIASSVEVNALNVGVNANFEAALLSASGSPVVFLCDQDDVWLPGRAKSMVEAIRAADALYLFSDAVLVEADLKPRGSLLDSVGVDQEFANALKHSELGAFRKLLSAPRATGAASCIDASLLDWSVPFPKEGWVHDEWLCFWAALAGRVHVLGEPTLLYRQHGANVVGMPLSRFDLSVYAKRWRQARDGEHAHRLAKKAISLRQAWPNMAPQAERACNDGGFEQRSGMVWRWIAYLEARASGGASWAQHKEFSPKPAMAWLLDAVERHAGKRRL